MFWKNSNESSQVISNDPFQQQYHDVDSILNQRDQIKFDHQDIIDLLKATKSFITGTPEHHNLTGTIITKKLNRLFEAFDKFPNPSQLSDIDKHYYNFCKKTVLERIELFAKKENIVATVFEASDSKLKILLGTNVQQKKF